MYRVVVAATDDVHKNVWLEDFRMDERGFSSVTFGDDFVVWLREHKTIEIIFFKDTISARIHTYIFILHSERIFYH